MDYNDNPELEINNIVNFVKSIQSGNLHNSVYSSNWYPDGVI